MGVVDRLGGELDELGFVSDDGWAVARLTLDDGQQITAVGPLAGLMPGTSLELEGTWSEHPRYGRRFKVESALARQPRTLDGLKRYLASGAVRGIGPELAGRVVDTFGLAAMTVLDEAPERLLEVPGIGKKRLEVIVGHWERDRAAHRLRAALQGYGLNPAIARRVIQAFGPQALGVLRSDPYRLTEEIEGVGFRTADRVAREVGIAKDDPRRAAAALSWALQEAEGQGHCFLPRDELLRRAEGLEVEPGVARQVLAQAVLRNDLVSHRAAVEDFSPVYREPMDRRERWVAEGLARRCAARPLHTPEALRACVDKVGAHLDEVQRDAVTTALGYGVVVITGGPGTGKTTIVRALVSAAEDLGEAWVLAAPTGRAARRLAESCDRDGSTLHRLLEYTPGEGFRRGRERPLAVDGVVVDEASMVDLTLMDALLSALPPGAAIVLVGDADQLPSVGPGRVLGDLVDAGVVPVVTLRRIYRQAEGSGIVRNAHRVLRGERPVSGEREAELGAPDFFLVSREEAEAARDTLVEIVAERLAARGFDLRDDVQVLTPMRRGPLGTAELNRLLQARLNPTGPELKRGDRVFREGDRVIRVRNDYDNEVFNGDVGRVVRVGPNRMEVDFGRSLPVEVSGDDLDEVALAYAISVHKSQGSEYPAVVLALHRAHFVMLRRSLLYTAITRAQRFCCVVGDPWALERAVDTIGDERRWTGLAERLAVMAAAETGFR